MFRIEQTTLVSFDDKVVVLGGYRTTETPVVVEFVNDAWQKTGELLSARYGHNAIAVENEVFVVGGYDSR